MWRAFQSGLVSFSPKEDASLRKFHTWNVLISCPRSLPGSRVLTEERALSWPCLQEVNALSPLRLLFFLLLLFPNWLCSSPAQVLLEPLPLSFPHLGPLCWSKSHFKISECPLNRLAGSWSLLISAFLSWITVPWLLSCPLY